MSKVELIEKTIASLKQLPEGELKAIHDFAEFLLSKIHGQLLTEEVTKLNTSSTSYKFLEEDTDLYAVNDPKAKFKSLTAKDAALGIGRKFTNDELSEYLERTAGGKAKDAAKVKRDLKTRLAKKIALK